MQKMTIRDFIFSEKRSDRIKRHLLFWLSYWIFLTFLHATSPKMKLPYAIIYSFSVLVPQVFFTYVLISFVLPKYLLKSKYFFSFLWILLFITGTALLNYAMLNYFTAKMAEILPKFFLGQFFLGRNSSGKPDNFFIALLVCFKGTMIAAAVACSIRLVKHWHLKEKRSIELLKEKTEAQLQLLKAQVHPHFLFNTLNNIYSKAQNESPQSAKMIIELSHILRYDLDEGNRVLVPLEKELEMLTDYINLEKLRYDDQLDLHLSLPTATEGLYIAPLLLLPFVENCFRPGTSKMINDPWINLKIEVKATSLMMKLMNGKKYSRDTRDSVEPGIENVKKRLELLYKDRYELQIEEDEEVFVVNLRLELVALADPSVVRTPLNTQLEFAW
jgi:sensor histidine kinase YesM